MKDQTILKNEQGKQDILEHYRSLFSVLTVHYQERYLETSFGMTYVIEAGNKCAPPLLLFHGSCSNSAMWFADINKLSQYFHVFAIDIIGEAGFSAEKRLDRGTDDYALWINDIVEELGYQQVMLMGNSYGGWLCLKFATIYPKKVAKIVLLAASGIVPVKLSFIINTIIAVIRGEKGLKKLAESIYGDAGTPKQVVEFSDKIMRGFNPMTGSIPIIKDQQLKSLQMPLLFICGENDITMNAAKAGLRLKKKLPQAIVHIEPEGHLIYDKMAEVIPFLKGGE